MQLFVNLMCHNPWVGIVIFAFMFVLSFKQIFINYVYGKDYSKLIPSFNTTVAD